MTILACFRSINKDEQKMIFFLMCFFIIQIELLEQNRTEQSRTRAIWINKWIIYEYSTFVDKMMQYIEFHHRHHRYSPDLCDKLEI